MTRAYMYRESTCAKKKIYLSFPEAEDAAIRRTGDAGIHYRPFRCLHCNMYHLTARQDWRMGVTKAGLARAAEATP